MLVSKSRDLIFPLVLCCGSYSTVYWGCVGVALILQALCGPDARWNILKLSNATQRMLGGIYRQNIDRGVTRPQLFHLSVRSETFHYALKGGIK